MAPGAGLGYMGYVSPISVTPHLLWPQPLLHPLVLNAGDLVEQAVAVELQALVELAVRQPLPGEGERGWSESLGTGGGHPETNMGSPPTHGWDCRGRSWVC